LNADDRAVVDDILREVRATKTVSEHTDNVVRSLSTSLIGRANGTTYDEGGGRIGRLEDRVAEIEKRNMALLAMALTSLLGMVGYFIKMYIEKHP